VQNGCRCPKPASAIQMQSCNVRYGGHPIASVAWPNNALVPTAQRHAPLGSRAVGAAAAQRGCWATRGQGDNINAMFHSSGR
jgi:hypothetical protein